MVSPYHGEASWELSMRDLRAARLLCRESLIRTETDTKDRPAIRRSLLDHAIEFTMLQGYQISELPTRDPACNAVGY